MGGIKIALSSIGLKALQDIVPQTKTFKLFSVLSVSSILMMPSHRIKFLEVNILVQKC